MKIGIDARLMSETGVGRYIRNLVIELGKCDTQNQYVIYLRKKEYQEYILPNARWQKRLADVHWHTVKEQFIMPWILVQDHLDIVHIPYFNVPIFYPGKFIITIHDLTILHIHTGKASTLPSFLYSLKRLMYRIILAVGLTKASSIIAVSKTTKDDIIKSFSVKPEKIHVIYEGIDKQLRIKNYTMPAGRQELPKKNVRKEPYFLYVGNAYPHKNLEMLVRAFCQFREDGGKERLVFVGKDDFFYKRLQTYVQAKPCCTSIHFLHHVTDAELSALYSHATALVFPSLMEGFGLPALEAASLGCPVIVSDIPIFHEILRDIPTYVSLTDSTSWVQAMKFVKKQHTASIPAYSWETMGKETKQVYERCVSL